MGCSNIKRFMSAAMLLAFMTPAAPVFSDSYYSSSVSSAYMPIGGTAALTDKNEPITLSLRDSDAKQVLRMFADKVGMNIIFHESVSGKVTLDLVKTPINEAFALVMQVAGLNYYKQGNTMIVISKNHEDNSAYSKQDMMVFPIHYVNAEKVADFLNRNVFSMKKTGMSGVDAATVNAATNELIVFGMPTDEPIIRKVIEQFDREPLSKTFAVNHTTPAEMADMICNLLLPSRGSSSSTGITGGAAGIVTGFAADSSGGEELKLGEGVVACTVGASSSGSTVAPFDVQNLSVAYFPQRGTITLMGGSEAQVRMVEKFIKDNDIKQPQAILEVSIIELNELGMKEFNNEWNLTSGRWSLSFDDAGTTARKNLWKTPIKSTEYVWDSPAPTGGQQGDTVLIPDGNGGGTIKVPQQIERTIYENLPGVKISWMMKYLIENRKARVLSNPKILITNGQESTIDLTQDYVEKVTTEFLTTTMTTGGSAIGAVQKTYDIGDDLGIKVVLTPFISPEGYVTLNVKPEYSTIQEQVYDVNGLAVTLLSRRDLDLKNVRIKDGETLVLGGMIQEQEAKSVRKIPFLGDLPWVGPIFRSSSSQKTKSELVIMITPKIIDDGEGAVADSI